MASPNNHGDGATFDMHKLFSNSSNFTAPPLSNPNPQFSNPNMAVPSPAAFPPQTSSYPPPVASPYQYPPYANVHHQLLQHPQRSLSYPTPPLTPQYSPHNPNQTPSSNTNANAHGARLMAMLSSTSQPEILNVPSSSQMTHVQPSSSSGSDLVGSQQQGVVVSPGLSPSMMRLPSSKVPKGRHLMGDRVVYDISIRFPGEVQPQLEVTPITKYVSDPGLVLGRQIAVNKTYICYGLKLGAVRVLNINTALRSLLKGLSQRVTDAAFFAEDVHLLASASIDGRVYVWKITEGNDEENKPQITGRIVIAIQITGVGESVHPRVCWHCHKQEVLVVGIGRYVLKIDTNKAGKGQKFVLEEPLKCPIDKLIDGVQLVGSHDGEVTDLSMCQWMTTRLASVSADGTIKIWEDRKPLPTAVFRPHDGQPVNSVTFLAAPDRPDHIILVTGGPLNREMKIWVSSSEEGWLLPSDTESWHCTQTLELKSSEARVEEAFFNQVISLSQPGLLLLANAKRNAIYAVHLEYGPNPLTTRMDYIAEFTVAMPILSFTATCESLPHGGQVVQVYCVQTQAIQQYALDLSQCLPPPVENGLSNNTDSSFSRSASAEGLKNIESSGGKNIESSSTSTPQGLFDSNGLDGASMGYPVSSDSASLPRVHDVSSVTSPLHPPNPILSRTSSGGKSSLTSSEHIPSFVESNDVSKIVDCTVDRQMDVIRTSLSDIVSKNEGLTTGDNRLSQDDPMATSHQMEFKHPTHLVTPSEILMARSSSDTNRPSEPKNDELNHQKVGIGKDTNSTEGELKVVGESRLGRESDDGAQRELHTYTIENNERSFYSQASDLGIQMVQDFHAESPQVYAVDEAVPSAAAGETEEVAQLPDVVEESGDAAEDLSDKVSPSASLPVEEQPASKTKGKKQKGKGGQVLRSSSPTPPGAFYPSDSFESGAITSTSPDGSVLPHIFSMQDMLNQLMDMQKEMQKQMAMTVVGPITKEVKRIEASLGRSMEKAAKANADALWVRLQEENTKQDRAARERMQQLTNVISNCLNKDFPTVIEKTVKRELTAVGQSVARTISPAIEKTISTTVAECFQKGVGDKAVNQLDKSVNSKLEATITKQIQAQFQTSGKQALQESLKSSLEASVIPAFEMACRAIFEQVDATFQKGLAEHTSTVQQQFDASHTPLALTLRDAINSASSMTQTLSKEILDSQRKLLDLAVTGANSTITNPLLTQLSNGPLSLLHEKIEVPPNPTKELSMLLADRKYEEAFTVALQRSDVSIVSWLCSQVDLPGLLAMNPLPLSQGVLLSLLQQLACDVINGTQQKLTWMLNILSVLNPSDRMIALHIRPILEQVYQVLHHHRGSPLDSGRELSDIRLILHVINSMLLTSK